MKNKIRKICACILCAGLCFSALAGCNIMEKPKPILKITTSSELMLFPATKTNYYIVYDNGTMKKTDKFEPADVECYDFIKSDYEEGSQALYGLDINTPQGEKMNQIANAILFLTEEPKLKIIEISRLYVLSGRYFFKALYDQDKRIGKLYEYLPDDNCIKEIISSSKSITHVELYEPESDGGE